MTARITLDRDVTPVGKGWRVSLPDGTSRMVLPRQSDDDRWAVFSGLSNDRAREPELGFPGSWGSLDHAIGWARKDGQS